MKIADLPKQWETGERTANTGKQEYEVNVTLEDAARLRALAELYPDYSEEELLRDLLNAALSDLPESGRRK
ncbi:hypothetical protein [Salicola sp. Rm-C-2C1-2]|uniref:hypothetical protein n=1 Tax=Salicola sp. Rm-C-2C1-2 TaxID=3141321 RepID=UPI0032E441DC